MSLFDCIQRAINNPDPNYQLDPVRWREAQQEFTDTVEDYVAAGWDRRAAEDQAKDDILQLNKVRSERYRHERIKTLQARVRLARHVQSSADPARALKPLLTRIEGHEVQVDNVDFQRRAIQQQANGELGEFLRSTSRNILGRNRAPALIMDVVRELHGVGTKSPSAKRMADALSATFERLRVLYNQAGGHIGKLDDFGLPHSHDAVRIRKAGFDAWSAAIDPELDWSKIINRKTGKAMADPGMVPLPHRRREYLQAVFDAITTEGWARRKPSGQRAGAALYNQRADHRELHFRGPDSWMSYNDAFGTGNAFDAIMGHISGMARDIALMRVLGPNPKAGLEFAAQLAEKRASTGSTEQIAKVRRARHATEALMSSIDGTASAPVHEGVAAFFAGTRDVLTSAYLGSAILSSASDLYTARLAAQAIGLNKNALTARNVQLLSSQSTRETAAQMGYIADSLADAGSTQARFLGDVYSPEMTRTLASGVLRASGLTFWTDMARTAFRMEFAAELALHAGQPMSSMRAPLRDLLQQRGIDDAAWSILGDPAALFTAPNGSKFLSPGYFVHAAKGEPVQIEALSLRLSSIIEEQLEFAVPSVSLEARAALIERARPGTFGGELLRSVTMFKSYGMSITLNQYRRIMAQPTGMSRAQYAAQLVAGLTLMGAVSVQLKELAKGRDPRPMDDRAFWGAATLQGGGFGIFGDFFSSSTSRAGGGFAETLAGPVAGFAGDVIRLGASNITRGATDENTYLGRDVANLFRQNTPGTSLWYARTALDRLVWDQMQRAMDPEAEAAWRRSVTRQQRTNGNGNWWERGEVAPARAPDLSNILGGNR